MPLRPTASAAPRSRGQARATDDDQPGGQPDDARVTQHAERQVVGVRLADREA